MEKYSQPFFNGREDTLKDAAGSVGRALSRCEEAMASRWYEDSAAQSEMQAADDSGILLAPETGDGAGIVALTDDYACVFKTVFADVSPSGDPAQAYGKVWQDVFVHGAQPLASLISLSLGETADAEVGRVTASLSAPCNIYGVAVAGGDVSFGSAAREIRAAVMAAGVIDRAAQLYPAASGEGNHVYLLSAYDEKTPAVFSARTTYELICDLHDENLLVAVCSVGRNGVLDACAGMVAEGNGGMDVRAEKLIPTVDDFHDLLQYQPDRIVAIVREEHHSDMERICRKWNKQWLRIGTVTDEPKLSVLHGAAVMADIPAETIRRFKHVAFAAGADLPPDIPQHDPVHVPEPDSCKEVAETLVSSPNLSSRQWFFNCFDSTAGGNNLTTNFLSDASVLQSKGLRHAIALSFEGSLCAVEKYPEAVYHLVADIVRKSVCSGGVPLAVTGCMSCSGDPAVLRETARQIRSHLSCACKQLGVASTDVRVQYLPAAETPSVRLSLGGVAFLEDKRRHMTISFKGKGDMIYMIGRSFNDLNSSEYVRFYHHRKDTPPPLIDMDAEAKLLAVAQKLISRKLVKSAHGVSRGGLFMSLLESAMVRGFGFDITVDGEIRKDAFLFGEAASRMVVSVATSREADFIDFMMEDGAPFITLGHVTREEIRIDDYSYGFIGDYKQKYSGAAI
ncbi:MAG: hypothetical protein LBR08_03710 [Bacteroidales bacterium]|nr:hypothetical protein [Bacteroidales bacterium]